MISHTHRKWNFQWRHPHRIALFWHGLRGIFPSASWIWNSWLPVMEPYGLFGNDQLWPWTTSFAYWLWTADFSCPHPLNRRLGWTEEDKPIYFGLQYMFTWRITDLKLHQPSSIMWFTPLLYYPNKYIITCIVRTEAVYLQASHLGYYCWVTIDCVKSPHHRIST